MKEYRDKLLKIAIPIMVSNLISQIQMLIDRIFVGRLDITCMSAVGNASSPMWTTMGTVFSLTVGATILASQAVGAGEREKAKAIIGSLFKYNNVLSTILFVFWFACPGIVYKLMGVDESIVDMSITYARIYSPVFITTGIGASVSALLQISEKTKILVWYGIIRSGLNIVLDYAMIFGHFGLPRMEVAGAALATTIAEYVGEIVVLIYLLKAKDLLLRPSVKEIATAKIGYYLTSIKMGIPVAAEDFAWNFGNLFLIAMLNKVSIAAAGIYSIVFGVECVPIVLIGSLGNATLTLAGQETGKKNYKGVKDVVRTALIMCAAIAAFVLVMFRLFPNTIMGWFTTDMDIIAASAVYLLIVGIDLFPKSGNIVIGSGIKGYGDTRWMLGTQIFGTCFVIGMSALVVLGLHLGMEQLFCVVVADETIRCIINYFKLRKISSRVA